MCLYEHNKNVPKFMYWTCVLVFETAAKRAVGYVKTVSKECREVTYPTES